MDKKKTTELSQTFLQALPPLPVADLLPAEIIAMGSRQHIARREQLGHCGEKVSGVFYINKGLARTFRISGTGERKTLHIIGRGYFIFESYFFSNSPLQLACEAIKNLELICFSHSTIDGLMQEKSFFVKRLLFSMGLKMQLMGHDLVSMAYEKQEARIKFCIASLAINIGNKLESMETAIKVDITQNELAELAGVHRVSISRILNKFQCHGIINIKRGKLIILPNFFIDSEIRLWNSQGYRLPFS